MVGLLAALYYNIFSIKSTAFSLALAKIEDSWTLLHSGNLNFNFFAWSCPYFHSYSEGVPIIEQILYI